MLRSRSRSRRETVDGGGDDGLRLEWRAGLDFFGDLDHRRPPRFFRFSRLPPSRLLVSLRLVLLVPLVDNFNGDFGDRDLLLLRLFERYRRLFGLIGLTTSMTIGVGERERSRRPSIICSSFVFLAARFTL